jgi:hypothetical protein
MPPQQGQGRPNLPRRRFDLSAHVRASNYRIERSGPEHAVSRLEGQPFTSKPLKSQWKTKSDQWHGCGIVGSFFAAQIIWIYAAAFGESSVDFSRDRNRRH